MSGVGPCTVRYMLCKVEHVWEAEGRGLSPCTEEGRAGTLPFERQWTDRKTDRHDGKHYPAIPLAGANKENTPVFCSYFSEVEGASETFCLCLISEFFGYVSFYYSAFELFNYKRRLFLVQRWTARNDRMHFVEL